jgi:hypothetical protein
MPVDAEWWYNDAAYHYAKGESLSLARLETHSDKTARVQTDAETLDFESREAATEWLLDEEYRRLQDLIEANPDPRIRPPQTDADTGSSGQMVIDLRGGTPPVALPGPDTSPAHR